MYRWASRQALPIEQVRSNLQTHGQQPSDGVVVRQRAVFEQRRNLIMSGAQTSIDCTLQTPLGQRNSMIGTACYVL